MSEQTADTTTTPAPQSRPQVAGADIGSRGPANPATPEKIKKAERQIMALTMRKQGASFRAIAAQMRSQPGISPRYNAQAAHFDVMAALKELNETQKELAAENQRLDLERLDQMLVPVLENARKGDVMSVNAALNIMDRRQKMLGYTAPDTSRTLNFDASSLSDEQLLRIANGEDPARVIVAGQTVRD